MRRVQNLVMAASALLLAAVAFIACDACDDYGGCFPLKITIDAALVPGGGSVVITAEDEVIASCGVEEGWDCNARDGALVFYGSDWRPETLDIRIADAEGVEVSSTVVRPSYTETVNSSACSDLCRNAAYVTIGDRRVTSPSADASLHH